MTTPPDPSPAVDLDAPISADAAGGSSPSVIVAAAITEAPGQVIVTPPAPESEQTVSPSSMIRFSAEYTTSPYPAPAMLRDYNEAIPGFADRLVSFLEQESKHRRGLETKQAEAEFEDMRAARSETARGQWYGLIIGIVAILSGSAVSIWGNPTAGGFIGTAGVVGLVSVFLARRQTQDDSQGKVKSTSS